MNTSESFLSITHWDFETLRNYEYLSRQIEVNQDNDEEVEAQSEDSGLEDKIIPAHFRNQDEEFSDFDDIFEENGSNDNGPNMIERYDNSAENDILDEDLEFFG